MDFGIASRTRSHDHDSKNKTKAKKPNKVASAKGADKENQLPGVTLRKVSHDGKAKKVVNVASAKNTDKENQQAGKSTGNVTSRKALGDLKLNSHIPVRANVGQKKNELFQKSDSVAPVKYNKVIIKNPMTNGQQGPSTELHQPGPIHQPGSIEQHTRIKLTATRKMATTTLLTVFVPSAFISIDSTVVETSTESFLIDTAKKRKSFHMAEEEQDLQQMKPRPTWKISTQFETQHEMKRARQVEEVNVPAKSNIKKRVIRRVRRNFRSKPLNYYASTLLRTKRQCDMLKRN